MRRTLVVASLLACLAAAVVPVSSASAYCDFTWQRITGDCNSCETVNRVTGRTGPCPD